MFVMPQNAKACLAINLIVILNWREFLYHLFQAFLSFVIVVCS